MDCDDIGIVGARLVAEARALRAAYPDAAAMRALGVSDVSPVPAGRVGAALRHLRDEMLLVRSGQAGTAAVLDDELALAERALAESAPRVAVR